MAFVEGTQRQKGSNVGIKQHKVFVFLDEDGLYTYGRSAPSRSEDVRGAASEDDAFKMCQQLNKEKK